MIDEGSAIDDSFQPIYEIPRARPFDDIAPPYAIRGPQTGRWSVNSGVGFAIDDDVPTVWDLKPKFSQGRGRRIQEPLAEGLLKKLTIAGLDAQKAEVSEDEDGDKERADNEQKQIKRDELRASKPKGFYLPRMNEIQSKGVKITGKQGREAVVQAPKVRSDPHKQQQNERPGHDGKPKKARVPSPQPVPKVEKVPSRESNVSAHQKKFLHIVGKNGEAAVVDIPVLPWRPRSAAKALTKPLSKAEWKPRSDEERLQLDAQKMKHVRMMQNSRAGVVKTAADTLKSPSPARTPSASPNAAEVDGRPIDTRDWAFDPSSKSQTVFAGKGWISPHPLSGGPSEVASAINVPSRAGGHGEKMTYGEWKAVQSGRGDWTKTESVVSEKVLSVAASLAKSGSVANGGQRPYQASVESERGSQRSRGRRSDLSSNMDWNLPKAWSVNG